jgi:hypothetical protein
LKKKAKKHAQHARAQEARITRIIKSTKPKQGLQASHQSSAHPWTLESAAVSCAALRHQRPVVTNTVD